MADKLVNILTPKKIGDLVHQNLDVLTTDERVALEQILLKLAQRDTTLRTEGKMTCTRVSLLERLISYA